MVRERVGPAEIAVYGPRSDVMDVVEAMGDLVRRTNGSTAAIEKLGEILVEYQIATRAIRRAKVISVLAVMVVVAGSLAIVLFGGGR
jgi:hypothetical protein